MTPFEANRLGVTIASLKSAREVLVNAKPCSIQEYENAMTTVSYNLHLAICNLQAICPPGSPDESKKHELHEERRKP